MLSEQQIIKFNEGCENAIAEKGELDLAIKIFRMPNGILYTVYSYQSIDVHSLREALLSFTHQLHVDHCENKNGEK